jgi:PAS domain S-box-containing protein
MRRKVRGVTFGSRLKRLGEAPGERTLTSVAEFYNISQYGREYVIGRNCRFLQGPETSNASVRRMIDAIAAGQEITETILNYRRDGSPFMNLLMLAPLYDNKGHVRYFIGCQIDVSSLIEGGRGLESFATLLARDRAEDRFGDSLDQDPKRILGDFGAMLNGEESTIIKSKSRPHSRYERLCTRTKEEIGHGRRAFLRSPPLAAPKLWAFRSLAWSVSKRK